MMAGADYIYLAGFLVNFIAAYVIVRYIYCPRHGERSYLFTFLAFNTIIYFIMGLFTSVEISIGVGFGLFALFSILRYRTETVPIQDMTYLFLMVALPILNSILFGTGQYEKLIIIDVLIIVVIWALEKGWGFNTGYFSKPVVYEKITLIHPGRKAEMIEDLKARTGLDVVGFDITRINFLKDTAQVKVYYKETQDLPETRKNKN